MRYAQWLPFPSATVAVLAFFLPWFAVSCQSPITQKQQKIAFSGYHFASGNMPPVVEGMFLVQQKLAGLGTMMMAFFQKKKAKPIVKKDNPLTVLRRGFPALWGAMASFAVAALLGLWLAIRGPTTWLRVTGTLAVFLGIGCLLYPLLTTIPTMKRGPGHTVKMLSVNLEIGGYLLLLGITGSLFGFLATPCPQPLPTLDT